MYNGFGSLAVVISGFNTGGSGPCVWSIGLFPLLILFDSVVYFGDVSVSDRCRFPLRASGCSSTLDPLLGPGLVSTSPETTKWSEIASSSRRHSLVDFPGDINIFLRGGTRLFARGLKQPITALHWSVVIIVHSSNDRCRP